MQAGSVQVLLQDLHDASKPAGEGLSISTSEPQQTLIAAQHHAGQSHIPSIEGTCSAHPCGLKALDGRLPRQLSGWTVRGLGKGLLRGSKNQAAGASTSATHRLLT